MPKFQLELQEVPPSLNTFGSVGGGTHHRYRRLKKEWQKSLGTALMLAGVPRANGKITASARMRFSRKAKRDEGNFRFLLEKALGDILVQGGWLADDDTGDNYSFGRVIFEQATGSPLTVIELEVEPLSALTAQPHRGGAENSQLESGDPKSSSAAKPRWRRRVKG